MEKKKVFVIMPFKDEFFEVYEMLKTEFAESFEFTNAGDEGNQQNILKDIIQEAVPNDPQGLYLATVSLLERKETHVYKAMEQKARKYFSETPEEERDARFYFWAGRFYDSMSEYDLAQEALGKSLELDPENDAAYESNLARYVDQLEALDEEYQAAVGAASSRRLLFGDRFPFRYLVEDYGLDYYAAFPGCSAETEASFETIAFLADKIDELGIGAVMTIDGSDDKLARIIVQATKNKDQAILTLDSMQSINAKDMAAGATYLSIMEKNLEVLKEALG